MLGNQTWFIQRGEILEKNMFSILQAMPGNRKWSLNVCSKINKQLFSEPGGDTRKLCFPCETLIII